MAGKTSSLLILLYASIISLLRLEPSESAPQSSRVIQLPGFNGTFLSKHYSGYVTLDERHGKQVFYYFVESERNPSKDPVLLWLNGGPGCSSFDGFIYEHGPFNFEAAKTKGGMPKLHLNPYSWSKVSNVIYLDSPSGVGYSFSKNVSEYKTGDLKTASDNHKFLLKWFKLYPEFMANPFFIAGESYGGIYVPTLAHDIIEGLKAGVKPTINLKGYMVGNGVTDNTFDGNAIVPFAHGMGLISDDLYLQAKSSCRGKYFDPTSDGCAHVLWKIDKVLEGLNTYNILEPCYHEPGKNEHITGKLSLPSSFTTLGETTRPILVRKRMFGRAWPLRAPVRVGIVPSWSQISNDDDVPCYNDVVATIWLNNEAVRKALHAEKVSVAGRWELCTDRLVFYHDSGSMIEYHRNLTSQGYRVLIYSGDHDMCVPYTGSEAWTRSLGYKIVDEWRPWICNGQVAGFLQGYDKNLTFLTIKGSGHTVPEYKPREALWFYSKWLEGKII